MSKGNDDVFTRWQSAISDSPYPNLRKNSSTTTKVWCKIKFKVWGFTQLDIEMSRKS